MFLAQLSTPPTPFPSTEVIIRGNVFRPDNNDILETETNSEILDNIYIDGVTNSIFSDLQDLEATRVLFHLRMDGTSTNVSAGLSYFEEYVIPELRFSTMIVDEENLRLKLKLDYGLNTTDVRAIEEVITNYVIGADVRVYDGFSNFSLRINSDDVSIFQNYLEIPISKSNAITLVNFTRASSGNSDNYWTPDLFTNTGVRFAVPITEQCGVGVMPGFSYEEDDGDTETNITFPVGFKCDFGNFEMSARTGYGLVFETRYEF